MKKAVAILTSVTLVLALAFLYLKVREFSGAEHERFQTSLWRLKHLDTAFNVDALAARFSLVDSYDDFQAYSVELGSIVEELKVAPTFMGEDGRQSLEEARLAYRALLDERARFFERFKSQNAMLANSRRYLPLALDQLAARLGESAGDRELEIALSDLTRLALMRLSTPDEVPQQAQERLQRLQDWCAAHPEHPEAKFAGSVLRHARNIVMGNGELDALTRRLIALPTEATIQRLFLAYQSDVASALRRAHQYRVLLYALGFLTTVGLGYSLWALRTANRNLEGRVKARTEELRLNEEKFRLITENSADLISIINTQGRQTYRSPSYQRLLEHPPEALAAGSTLDLVHPEDRDRVTAITLRIIQSGTGEVAEYRVKHRNGTWRTLEAQGVPFRNGAGLVDGVLVAARDVTERKQAESQHQTLELQLRQAQKLEAIGQLAAGIAHEINTPTQYVGDNTRFVRDSFANIVHVMQNYEELLAAAKNQSVKPDLIRRVDESIAASDLKYLFEQIPAAIGETLEGVERVTKIVRAMKEFSHPGAKEKAAANLNKAIETTVTVAGNEWKYIADVSLELDPDLPSVPCFLGEFNQVILNLIVNAAHAIGDVVPKPPGGKGRITVRTRRDGEHVEIRVSDTGTGIPEADRPKIFEPFFTTKDVGKGTGQGLSIVYGSIVKKHGGTVAFETEVGVGTTFVIRLPIIPKTNPGSRPAENGAPRLSNTRLETTAPAAAPARQLA